MKRKLIAVLVLAMMFLTFGCEAYVELDTTFEAVVGEWHLNCVYKDTHPIEFKDESITINADGSGIYSTLVTDENGVTSENSKALTAKASAETEETQTITLTVDGVSTEYIFRVDVPAQLLHLYVTDEEGCEIHYVYVNDLVEY
ncbi:MAG: hypothetical protein IKM61_03270 [Eubacteriaceae bacterium]|nr:hypothetical protein [Eubacteriaceae bacterium]